MRVIICTLLMGLLFEYGHAQPSTLSNPLAHEGVLDLRFTPLDNTHVTLSGEWRFFWKQLLPPSAVPDQRASFVRFPSLWKDDKINDQALTPVGYATYALTVLLPKDRPRLALQVPDVYSSYKLFSNGSVIAQNGQPATTAKGGTPFWSTQVIVLPNGSDTMQLVLQVANFWHSKGGTYKELLLGDKDELLLTHHRDRAFDLLLSGCLFMGGLFFFGLFAFSRKDKAILFFSLFCMVYSYRMIGTDLYVLHSLFPHLSWFISIRIEYLTLVIPVVLYTQYTVSLYPEEGSLRYTKAVEWLALMYSVLILVTPPSWFTQLLNPFLVIMLIYTLLAFYIFIQACRHKRSGSVYALASSGVMVLVFLVINLQYFEVIPALKVGVFCGYIAFFFLQSLVLSHRFSETLRNAAQQAQQGLKSKSEFLSTMSHEIRTPLNSVIGMTHILKRSQPREDQKNNLNVLLFSANNLLAIVNNILDYNKIEAGKISFERIAMDLPAIARNIVWSLKSLADEKKLPLYLDIDEQLTHKVMGDPTRISQVLNNLLHNAIKFTNEGWVRLSIKIIRQTESDITIGVSVRDTGIGIPPEKQQLIFERFTQADSSTSRRYGGTGLGLSISKKILALQGAQLKLKSEPGKGTEFYFTQSFGVSAIKIEQSSDKGATAETGQLLKDIGILLVEDNPINVLVAQTFLERFGAIVDVAINGQEAMEQFNKNKHDLILMDLDMPVMDGYEATRQLRKRGERIPVIALTASLPVEVENGILAAGFNDILVKPFDPDDLFRIILHHLQNAAA